MNYFEDFPETSDEDIRKNKRGVPNSLIARSWLKRKNKMLSHLTWHLGKLWPHARTLGLTKPTEALPEEINKQIDENRKAIENSKSMGWRYT